MSLGDREDGLIARIRHIRRVAPTSATRPAAPSPDLDAARLERLETRLGHLEELLEGLQDSIHREALRQSKRIAELEARTEPAALAVVLSKDARERGL